MIGIFMLIAAVSAVAALARGRGGKPWVWGTIGVLGYFVVSWGLTVMLQSIPSLRQSQGGSNFALNVSVTTLPWLWLALVAGYIRFFMGRGMPQPPGKWACENCFYTNSQSSVVCEACKEPWKLSEGQ